MKGVEPGMFRRVKGIQLTPGSISVIDFQSMARQSECVHFVFVHKCVLIITSVIKVALVLKEVINWVLIKGGGIRKRQP